MAKQYSSSYYEKNKEQLYNFDTRTRKAKKLRLIAKDFLKSNLDGLAGIDIGCSSGIISSNLAQAMGIMIGLDRDSFAINYAASQIHCSNTHFMISDALAVPFPDNFFDLVVSAQNYEHVLDANLLSEEIFRILKPGGICLFSGPNRLAIMEDHYHLPFLSWLSPTWANYYVRWSGRGNDYPIRPLTLWGLRNLWKKFEIYDYTLRLIQSPEIFGVDDEMSNMIWVKFIPVQILKLVLFLVPNYNWVLQKPN